MQALVEMKSPINTLTSLQLFYDSTECHIQSLQSLGSPEEMYAPMLIPTILKKLPAEVHRNLARPHGTEKWTLTDLRRCILQESRILDMGAEYSTAPHSPTAAFTASVDRKLILKQPPAKKSCLFCKSPSHAPSRCEVITDTQKRIEVVKKENLCFNCLLLPLLVPPLPVPLLQQLVLRCKC